MIATPLLWQHQVLSTSSSCLTTCAPIWETVYANNIHASSSREIANITFVKGANFAHNTQTAKGSHCPHMDSRVSIIVYSIWKLLASSHTSRHETCHPLSLAVNRKPSDTNHAFGSQFKKSCHTCHANDTHPKDLMVFKILYAFREFIMYLSVISGLNIVHVSLTYSIECQWDVSAWQQLTRWKTWNEPLHIRGRTRHPIPTGVNSLQPHVTYSKFNTNSPTTYISIASFSCTQTICL